MFSGTKIKLSTNSEAVADVYWQTKIGRKLYVTMMNVQGFDEILEAPSNIES